MGADIAPIKWALDSGGAVDHAEIDAGQVAERYLAGKLPPEEASRFEEHSLSCAECLDRLEAAEALGRSLRAVAAEEVAARVVQATWLARTARSRWAPWALGLLFVVALLPSFFWARENGRLNAELAAVRSTGEVGRPRPAEPPSAAPPEEIAALRERLAAAERSTEGERRERERLARELARSQAPRINVAVVPLSPERSAPAPGAAPSTRVTLASATEWIVLSLELATTEHPSYRATLLGPTGAALWSGVGLLPDAAGTLHLALPARLLPNGDVLLRIEGSSAEAGPVPVASFSLRVARSR